MSNLAVGLLAGLLALCVGYLLIDQRVLRSRISRLERALRPETTSPAPKTLPRRAENGAPHKLFPLEAIDPAGQTRGGCVCGDSWEGQPGEVLDQMEAHRRETAGRK